MLQHLSIQVLHAYSNANQKQKIRSLAFLPKTVTVNCVIQLISDSNAHCFLVPPPGETNIKARVPVPHCIQRKVPPHGSCFSYCVFVLVQFICRAVQLQLYVFTMIGRIRSKFLHKNEEVCPTIFEVGIKHFFVFEILHYVLFSLFIVNVIVGFLYSFCFVELCTFAGSSNKQVHCSSMILCLTCPSSVYNYIQVY